MGIFFNILYFTKIYVKKKNWSNIKEDCSFKATVSFETQNNLGRLLFGHFFTLLIAYGAWCFAGRLARSLAFATVSSNSAVMHTITCNSLNVLHDFTSLCILHKIRLTVMITLVIITIIQNSLLICQHNVEVLWILYNIKPPKTVFGFERKICLQY